MPNDINFDKKSLENYWQVTSFFLRAELDKIITNYLKKDHEICSHYKGIWELKENFEEGERDWKKLSPEKQIVAAHGFWMLWYDDARNEFCFPDGLVDREKPIYFGEHYPWNKAAKDLYRDTAVAKGYNLASGAGSLGLGVRLNTGVCLRDTIRDIRGSVAFEDILSSNYSFIGVPLYRSEHTEQLDGQDSSGKPFVVFCLLFPLRGAWHDDSKSCCIKDNKAGCFFSKIKNFCEDKVKPIAELAYELLELRASQKKTENLTELGNTVDEGQFRATVLDTFVNSLAKQAQNTPDAVRERDLLGFKTAALFEKGKTEAEQPACISVENLKELRFQHLESSYHETDENKLLPLIKELFPESANDFPALQSFNLMLGNNPHGINIKISYLCTGSLSSADFSWFIDQYNTLIEAPHPWPTTNSAASSMIDGEIEKIKWEELVHEKVCQSIADFLVGDINYAAVINYLVSRPNVADKAIDRKPNTAPPLMADRKIFLVMITTAEEWGLVKQAPDSKDNRYDYELHDLQHTRRTIFRMLTALERQNALPTNSTNEINTTGGHWPELLKSEATQSQLHIDCSAHTVLNNGKLLKSWEKTTTGHEIIQISNVGNINEYSISIGEHLFAVSKSTPKTRGLGISIANSLRVKLNTQDKFKPREITNETTATIYKEIISFFSAKREKCPTDNCLPCLSKIAKNWYVTWTKPLSTCQNNQCNLWELNAEDIGANLEKINQKALDVGVNTYIISPLWVGKNIQGFLLLGSPQREYDTPNRISFSDEQLNAVKATCDFLKLAISLEIKSKQSEKANASANQVKHLAGIEPEIRKLIEDVNKMKRAAERVANKIAPAQHGVFAYDSETIKLFRTKGCLTVELDITGREKLKKWKKVFATDNIKNLKKIPDTCAERLQQLLNESTLATEWNPALSLSIQEGNWVESPAQWRMKTVHENINFTTWDEHYRPMLYVLGLSRGNALLKAFAKYNFSSFDNKNKNVAVQKIFETAKEIFHRLHFPGNAINRITIFQILAALSGFDRKFSFNYEFENAVSVESNLDYGGFFKSLLSNGIIDKQYIIHERANAFIPALNQFCFEFMGDKTNINHIEVLIKSDICTINFHCNGSKHFNVDNLHRNEFSIENISEHGLTRTVIMLEKSLKSYLKENIKGSFYFIRKENDKVIFTIVLENISNNGGMQNENLLL